MYPRQRQATLRGQSSHVNRNSSDSQRRASASYADPGSFSGSYSAPVARLSKWPKNVFFASDFIAEKAAAASSNSARRRRPRRRACSTDARKAERGPRTTAGGHEPATGRRIHKDAAACRSSDSNRAVPQSIQGRIECEESTPDVARGEEGGTFLEESASALLLLHSRFFGGVRQEEGIVCRLCMLCREAGWMGNPLRASPDLDPLVLEKMMVARLRSTGRCDVRRQRNSTSGNRKNNLSHSEASEEEVFSFEAFYRILADIATLVFPREGEAMQRLLLEGVLPLAADNEPRTWSPSPELLYGRPALAALSMQRDALHQLYCTYQSDSIDRTENSSGGITTGISRGAFFEMLVGLGVTPVSVSEPHAASVFDNTSRNGLSLSSRKPRGDRLCWSSFLEAMAALAVGAVKEGHTTATAKGQNRRPVRKPGSWNKADLDCNRINSGRPGENAREARPRRRVRSPGEGRFPERRAPVRIGGEFGCAFEDEAGEKEAEKLGNKGARGAPSAWRHARAASFSEKDHQDRGGGFYHDSRREVELMPTLREIEMDAPWEHPSSPVRAQLPSRLQQTPQGGEGNMIVELGSTSTSTRPTATQPSQTSNTVTAKENRGEERGEASKARHSGDTASPILQENDEDARGALGRPSIEHRPTVKKRATHASSRAKSNVDVDVDVASAVLAACSEVLLSRPSVSSLGAATEVVDDAVRCGQDLDGLSKQRGTASTDACAGVEPAMARSSVSFSLKENGIDRRENGGLSPAPYHGGLLFAVQVPSSTTAAASDGLKKPSPSCRASLHQGKQPAQPLLGLESRAVDDDDDQGASFQPRSCHPNPTRLITGTSSGGGGGQSSKTVGTARPEVGNVREERSTLPGHRRTDQKEGVAEEESSSLRPGWGRHGRKRKEGLNGNEGVPQRERCSERGKEGLGHGTHIDNVAMNFEAASATIFDELLEPRVIAVYSRHREDLQKMFQRYSSIGDGPDGERLQYIGDSGIWRFVGDFPVLGRWVEGHSILRLIIRASRDRGWHRGGDEAEETAGQQQPPGLTYFGFLEVLTRMMAYASITDGEYFLTSQYRSNRSPLHLKLLAFISTLKVDDPRGILRL